MTTIRDLPLKQTKEDMASPCGGLNEQSPLRSDAPSAQEIERLAERFAFLDALRKKGTTNMFGAGPYLQRKFRGMSRDESHDVLSAWMRTFSKAPTPAERAALAKATP